MIRRNYSLSDLQGVMEGIEAILGSFRFQIAGPIRRGRHEDIDRVVFVVTGTSTAVLRGLEGLRGVTILARGSKIIRASYRNCPVTIGLTLPLHEGAALLAFTGQARFVKWIRREARYQGYKLTNEGLWEGFNLIASRTEEDIFKALGLGFVPPERRNHGDKWRT